MRIIAGILGLAFAFLVFSWGFVNLVTPTTEQQELQYDYQERMAGKRDKLIDMYNELQEELIVHRIMLGQIGGKRSVTF